MLIFKRYVCSKQGVHKKSLNAVNIEKQRLDIKREGRNSRVRLKLDKSTSQWMVVNFVEKHNHVSNSAKISVLIHK